MTLDNLSVSNFCMKSKSYMVLSVYLMTLTLHGIERSNQGHLVFIGLCIINNALLDSGAVNREVSCYINHAIYAQNRQNTTRILLLHNANLCVIKCTPVKLSQYFPVYVKNAQFLVSYPFNPLPGPGD